MNRDEIKGPYNLIFVDINFVANRNYNYSISIIFLKIFLFV